MDRLRTAVGVAGVHYAGNLVHGLAHLGVPVALTAFQMLFVVVVVGLLPLASLWMLRAGRARLAWASLVAILLASLVFGLLFHYVIDTADHVTNVPGGAWHAPFAWTAAALALADGGGAVLSLWATARSRQ